MELFQERIDAVWSKKGNLFMKFVGVFLMMIIIAVVYISYEYVGGCFALLVFLILVAYTEVSLKTNYWFARKRVGVSDGLGVAQTGDLVFSGAFILTTSQRYSHIDMGMRGFPTCFLGM